MFLNWFITCDSKGLNSREITSLLKIKKTCWEHGASFQSLLKINRMLITNKTHSQTMKVYNTWSGTLLLIKILFFFKHLRVHLFQSNQHFQAIEFVADPFQKSSKPKFSS